MKSTVTSTVDRVTNKEEKSNFYIIKVRQTQLPIQGSTEVGEQGGVVAQPRLH